MLSQGEKMKKLIGIFVLLIVGLAGCTNNSTINTFVVPIEIEPASLAPLEDVSATTKSVLRNMNSSLVEYDTDTGEIGYSLAQEITSEQNIYTITLKPGLTFHDGSSIDSEDVYYSFQRLAGEVEGFDGVDSSFVELMDGATVNYIDDLTLEITFNEGAIEKYAASMAYLFLDAFIVPSDYREAEQETNPVGAGPYMFKEYVPADHITMTKFDGYLNDEAVIDEVEFRIVPDASATTLAFQSGELDYLEVTSENNEAILQMESPTIISNEANDVRVTHMNNRVAPFDNIEIRQAVNYAIDKERIIENTSVGGTAVGSHMSPAMGNYFNESLVDVYDQDVEKAQELMKKNGYNEENHLNVELKTVAENDVDNDIALYLQEDLSNIYLDLTITPLPWDVFYQDVYVNKNFEMASIQIIGYPDPYDVMSRYGSDAEGNLPGLNNDEYDQLLNDARQESDIVQREEDYFELQKILSEEAISVFIMDSGANIALSAEYNSIATYPFAYIDISSVR